MLNFQTIKQRSSDGSNMRLKLAIKTGLGRIPLKCWGREFDDKKISVVAGIIK